MDHSWGRNVTETGLGDTGATLVAYLLPPSPYKVVTNAGTRTGRMVFWNIPLNPAIPMSKTELNVGIRPPHFPYGLSVTPDAPA